MKERKLYRYFNSKQAKSQSGRFGRSYERENLS